MCSAVSWPDRSALGSFVAGGFTLDPSDTRASHKQTDVIQATELARSHAAKLLWHGKHIWQCVPHREVPPHSVTGSIHRCMTPWQYAGCPARASKTCAGRASSDHEDKGLK